MLRKSTKRKILNSLIKESMKLNAQKKKENEKKKRGDKNGKSNL